MFQGMRIRHKLLLYYSLLYTLSLFIGFGACYFVIRDTIESNIESELQNTTTALYNLVRTSATVSIKNYLRGAAEKNLEILQSLHRDQLQGLLSEDEARQRAAKILLSQTIGESGYIYCLDGNGIVVVHPAADLVRSDVSEYSFVKDLMVKKRGYLEYEWKNPGEESARPKALYMIHFEPWDWFIAVSSYREEFKGLVNVDDFKESVLDLKFGKTGYAFVIDGTGTAIIHPLLEGRNILTLEGEGLPNEYLTYILKQKTGRVVYPWKNPGETKSRQKLCIFNSIPEYGWIVAASSYYEEFYEPLRTIGAAVLVTFAVTMLLVLTLTFKISESITSPLQKLMAQFENASRGDFSLRMSVDSGDELGQLAGFFNRFMEQLAEYSSSLKRQIEVREETEKHLRVSEERYHSVMEAAADPIVIYDMEGRVTYFNPAFREVFGWTLTECLGRKMDHFVPQENWPETLTMITAIREGRALAGTETRRYTRHGDVREVSISGAAFRGTDQQLAGSVVILRDITETKRLTKQLMDIGDNVRQTIGQDLHDDLCPHLIGIAGLVSALRMTIEQGNGEGAALAAKIVDLIAEATAKARNLARGLCPVHLVAYGLQGALAEIAEKTGQTSQIHCNFRGDETLRFTDNTLATHLYYIVQEAVNNAVKHAQATAIDICLSQDDEYIHLRIADNGRGMVERARGKGIGLQIMQYRALVTGAFLEVKSDKESGTLIHVFMKRSDL